MVKYNQFKNGLHKFLDQEMISKMEEPIRTISAIGLEVAMMKSDTLLHNLRENEIIKMLDVIHEDEIDVDTLYTAIKKKMNGSPLVMPTKTFGKITITPNDVDTLINLIRQG
jgi:hypothetical protein